MADAAYQAILAGLPVDFSVPGNPAEEDRLREKWRINNYYAQLRRGEYVRPNAHDAPWQQYIDFLEGIREQPGPPVLFPRQAAYHGRDIDFNTWDEIYAEPQRRWRRYGFGGPKDMTGLDEFPQAERDRVTARLEELGITLERFFNAGGNGAVALASGRRDDKRRKFVVKVGLNARAIRTITNEKNLLWDLRRAKHIIQTLQLNEVLPPGPDAEARDRLRRAADDFYRYEPFLLLEYMEHGDMEDLIVKCVERRLDLDHAQLWRMFACLIRGCIAMIREFPPAKLSNNDRWFDVEPHGPDLEEYLEDPEYRATRRRRYGMVHFDLDPQNVLVGPLDEDDHHSVPVLKLTDFGFGTRINDPVFRDEFRLMTIRMWGKSLYLLPEQYTKEWEYIDRSPHEPRIPPTQVAGQYGPCSNIFQAALCMQAAILQLMPEFPPRAVGPIEEAYGQRITNIDNQNIWPFWTHGGKLLRLQPQNASELELFHLLLRCLADKPADRPTLEELSRAIVYAETHFDVDHNDGGRWFRSIYEPPPPLPDIRAQVAPNDAGRQRSERWVPGAEEAGTARQPFNRLSLDPQVRLPGDLPPRRRDRLDPPGQPSQQQAPPSVDAPLPPLPVANVRLRYNDSGVLVPDGGFAVRLPRRGVATMPGEGDMVYYAPSWVVTRDGPQEVPGWEFAALLNLNGAMLDAYFYRPQDAISRTVLDLADPPDDPVRDNIVVLEQYTVTTLGMEQTLANAWREYLRADPANVFPPRDRRRFVCGEAYFPAAGHVFYYCPAEGVQPRIPRGSHSHCQVIWLNSVRTTWFYPMNSAARVELDWICRLQSDEFVDRNRNHDRGQGEDRAAGDGAVPGPVADPGPNPGQEGGTTTVLHNQSQGDVPMDDDTQPNTPDTEGWRHSPAPRTPSPRRPPPDLATTPDSASRILGSVGNVATFINRQFRLFNTPSPQRGTPGTPSSFMSVMQGIFNTPSSEQRGIALDEFLGRAFVPQFVIDRLASPPRPNTTSSLARDLNPTAVPQGTRVALARTLRRVGSRIVRGVVPSRRRRNPSPPALSPVQRNSPRSRLGRLRNRLNRR